MQVGDKIWHFDPYNGLYRGKAQKVPMHERWREMEVTGETARSWIIGTGCRAIKLPKNQTSWLGWATSKPQIEQIIWIEENAFRISGLVRWVRDYDTLRQIAKLVDYKEPEVKL